MITSPAVHKYVFPSVRELAGPEVGSEVPPERRVVRPSQRDRVAASLLFCPRSASGVGRRA